MKADSWRGELGDPRSRIRYSSVKNSRVSYADAFGFMHTRFDGGGGSIKSDFWYIRLNRVDISSFAPWYIVGN